MRKKNIIFIDGEEGTTGLEIYSKLSQSTDLEIIRLGAEKRKKKSAREDAINQSDITILCVPDEVARQAITLVKNPATKIIDASTAHRTTSSWDYGFTEYHPGYRKTLKQSKRICNPGCYAIGAISAIYPLVNKGILPRDWPLSINAVSGYSGGGKTLINEFENPILASPPPFYDYSLTLKHKHLPEIQHWGGVNIDPIFLPSVANYYKGMLVHIPLHLSRLPKKPSFKSLVACYQEHYGNEKFIEVKEHTGSPDDMQIDPQANNGTNTLRLHLLTSANHKLAIVVAQLDNLGKGASGQVLQNLNVLLERPEDAGLSSATAL